MSDFDPNLGLFPHNCARCLFWTATELRMKEDGFTLVCTHCNGAFNVIGDQRRTRLLVESIRNFSISAIRHLPELRRLRVRGAYVAY
jgi:hypothetical protein